jgi:threonine dehydrogenase-like Zn-dependent dehydrogenase
VNRAQVTDIDVVVVIGCGMVGMGAIVRSALRGATVIAADIDDEKLALAKEMGASYAINTLTEDVHARLQEITSGFGPDVIIEAVGSPITYNMAVNEVAFTGRVVCIGYAKTEVSFQTKFFVQKELDIRGSRNAQPSDFRAVIHYLQGGNCPVDRLISNVVAPEGAPEAMKQWSEAPGKVFRILVKFV